MIRYIYGSTHYSFKGIRATSYQWVQKVENVHSRRPLFPIKPQEFSVNKEFSLGDQIQVFNSDLQTNRNGSFIRFFGGVLIWADHTGSIRFQMLNGGISVRKIG
jgi:hypothetical protein